MKPFSQKSNLAKHIKNRYSIWKTLEMFFHKHLCETTMKLTCIKGNQSIPLLYFSWYMCYAIFDLYKKPTPLHIIREFSPNENSSGKFLYEAKKISWNLTIEQFIRLNLMAFRMPWKNNMLEILEFYTILSCVHARILFEVALVMLS